MVGCSVQINSYLDNQSKFQMLTLFSDRHVGVDWTRQLKTAKSELEPMLVSHGGIRTWRLHTGLCKFVQNIS